MLLAVLLAFAQVVQTTPPPMQAYHVEFRPRLQAFGYTGELKLYFSSDGYINGTYRPDTGGRLQSVRGGRQGDHIWFDVPALGGLHVEATMNDSGMSGVASGSGMSTKDYIFTAKPEASPSPS